MKIHKGTLITRTAETNEDFVKGKDYKVIKIISKVDGYIIFEVKSEKGIKVLSTNETIFWKISENDVQNLHLKFSKLHPEFHESKESETLTWIAAETPKNISITITINYT